MLVFKYYIIFYFVFIVTFALSAARGWWRGTVITVGLTDVIRSRWTCCRARGSRALCGRDPGTPNTQVYPAPEYTSVSARTLAAKADARTYV